MDDAVELSDNEASRIVQGRCRQIRKLAAPQPTDDEVRAGGIRPPVSEGQRIWFTFEVDTKYGRLVQTDTTIHVEPDGEIIERRLATRDESRMEADVLRIRLARLQDYQGHDLALEAHDRVLYGQGRDLGSDNAPRLPIDHWDHDHPFGWTWLDNPWVWVVEFDYKPKSPTA